MTDEALPAEDEAHGASPDPDEPPRVLLHMPVDVRSLSLIVLTVLASIYALHWAKAILVPILLGVMFSYALTPVVDTLQRWHLPRAAGAGIVLSTIVLLIGWGGWKLSDDATALIETLPQVAQKLRHAVESKGPASRRHDHREGAAGRQRAREGGASGRLEAAAAQRPPRQRRRRAGADRTRRRPPPRPRPPAPRRRHRRRRRA